MFGIWDTELGEWFCEETFLGNGNCTYAAFSPTKALAYKYLSAVSGGKLDQERYKVIEVDITQKEQP